MVVVVPVDRKLQVDPLSSKSAVHFEQVLEPLHNSQPDGQVLQLAELKYFPAKHLVQAVAEVQVSHPVSHAKQLELESR